MEGRVMNNTYCAKSHDCKNTNCPRHLKGFNGLYISLAEFDCEEVLNELQTNGRTTNFIETEQT